MNKLGPALAALPVLAPLAVSALRKPPPTGRRVLITGAGSGLGLELARRFLDRGDRVIATDLADTAPDAVVALGPSATYRRLDVTSDDDWAAAAAEFGGIDVLVLNAGVAVGGRIDKTPMETWQRAIDVNMLGIVRGCRAFAPKIPKGGQIVVTASLMGLIHPGFMSTYNATKAAAVAIAESLRHELKPRRISVTAICPQFFKTNLRHSLTGDDPAADYLANWLFDNTWLSVDAVADRAMRDINRRKLISTPDAAATAAWYGKRFAFPAYLGLTSLAMTFFRRKMVREVPSESGRG